MAQGDALGLSEALDMPGTCGDTPDVVHLPLS